MPADADLTRKTFQWEIGRSFPTGALDTLHTTFGVLIAVRVFDLSSTAKSVLLSSGSGGLILSLFLLPWLLKSPLPLSRLASLIQVGAAFFLGLTAAVPDSAEVYLIGIGGTFFLLALQVPLLTSVYQSNYPAANRGRLFSVTSITRALAGIAFGFGGGWLLGLELDYFQLLLWGFTLAMLLSAFCTWRLPVAPNAHSVSHRNASLRRALRWVRIDHDFRNLLIAWMIMGCGNLIAFALYVEYLANPDHGINLPEDTIAWVIGVVPVVFRLLFAYPWGLVYDKVNLFIVRATLNVVFAFAVLIFYLGESLPAWITAMALFGCANAGGQLTWSLWVTKLAPPEAVAEYMSVHTFLTGLRGLIAPYLAFFLIQHFSFQHVAIGCAAAILSASGLIAVKARSGDPDSKKRMRPGH